MKRTWRGLLGLTFVLMWGSFVSANPIIFSEIPYTEHDFIGAYLLIVIPCLLTEVWVVSQLFRRVGLTFRPCFVIMAIVNVVNYAAFHHYLVFNAPFFLRAAFPVEAVIVCVETIVVYGLVRAGVLPHKASVQERTRLSMIFPIILLGNLLSFLLSYCAGLLLVAGKIDRPMLFFSMTMVLYIVLLAWGIRELIRRVYGERVTTPPDAKEEYATHQTAPIFRTIRGYLWSIWWSIFLGWTTYLFAIHHLHHIERSESFGNLLLVICPYAVFGILMLRRFAKAIAARRRERRMDTSYSKIVYIIGILLSLLVYVICLERNPLADYGVKFDWYDPADEPGQYHAVHLMRHVHGRNISGPLCGGQYPRLTFSDEDQDGIDDIIVQTKRGEELGVFAIIEPYMNDGPAFRVLRGGEDACPTPSQPPYADYLKVTIF